MSLGAHPAGGWGRWVGLGGALGLAAALAACVTPDRGACQVAVPFVAQSPDRCGTAAVDMVLRFYGCTPDPDTLDRAIHIPALAGSIPALLAAAARQEGFAAEVRRSSEEELQRSLAAGQPLILMLGPAGEASAQGHFIVATGYRPRTGSLRVHSGSRANRWWPADAWRPRWEAAGCAAVWILPAPSGLLDLPSGLAQDEP